MTEFLYILYTQYILYILGYNLRTDVYETGSFPSHIYLHYYHCLTCTSLINYIKILRSSGRTSRSISSVTTDIYWGGIIGLNGNVIRVLCVHRKTRLFYRLQLSILFIIDVTVLKPAALQKLMGLFMGICRVVFMH